MVKKGSKKNNSYSEEEQELFKLYSKATKKQAVWKNKITQGFKVWKKEQKAVGEVEETEDMEEAIKEVKDAEADEVDEFDELLNDLEVEVETEMEEEEEEIEEVKSETDDGKYILHIDDDAFWIFHDDKYWLPTKKFAEIAGVVVQSINSRFRNNEDLSDHSILLKVNGNRKQRFFDAYAVEAISEKLKVNVYKKIKNQIPK